jgi:hypothetical protein
MQEPRQIPSKSPRLGDPFDPAAAVLYGQFIAAAYAMHDAAPNNPTPPPLNLTAGYRLAAWILMRDFIVGSTGPIFYGFVAQSEANLDQYVLAIRGTSGWVEWWDDLNAIQLQPFKDPGSGSVGAGFARIYDTLQLVTEARAPSAAAKAAKPAAGFASQVSALVSRRASAARPRTAAPPASIAVTGHSLGAALATLYVIDNALTERIHNPSIYTFASPRVGDSTFAHAFNALGLTSWRIDNLPDIVPQVPLGFTHVDTLKQYDSLTTVWPTPSCWHALATYLSLIDPRLKPDASCQWPAVAKAPGLARAAAAVSALATTLSIPAGPVTVNITINVGVREDGASD